MKKTKIVCTIGPASNNIETLERMIRAGMNVARINLSHGDHDEHRQMIRRIREAAAKAGVPLAVMVDTKGTGLRTGKLKAGKASLKEGDKVALVEDKNAGDEKRIPVNYKGLSKYVHPGDRILLQGGEIGLRVLEIRSTEILCQVLNSGTLGERKSVHVQNAELPTTFDESDIEFAADAAVDYISASFVRSAEDIKRIKEILGKSEIEVVAKIETREALEHIDEIINIADAVMVARGDLGVDLEVEELPLVQKKLVRKCNRAGKPVIIATQMLLSMVKNPRPTRAEATDVANAILDGTDAVMLSEETAIGEYPVEAVEIMSKIARSIENTALTYLKRTGEIGSVTEAIGESACEIAQRLNAAAIIANTTSGSTAKLVAKFRPKTPIVAVTYSDKVLNKSALIWGVHAIKIPFCTDTDLMLRRSIEAAAEAGFVKRGDCVVITAGVPFGVVGTTNFIKVERV